MGGGLRLDDRQPTGHPGLSLHPQPAPSFLSVLPDFVAAHSSADEHDLLFEHADARPELSTTVYGIEADNERMLALFVAPPVIGPYLESYRTVSPRCKENLVKR